MSEITPDPTNPRLVRDELIVHENPATVPTAPDLHVGPTPVQEAPATGVPLAGVSLPADGVMREVTIDAAPNPEAVARTLKQLDYFRVTHTFSYEPVTDVVRQLLEIAGVPAGIITGDERIVSMISFEDVPLRYALDRLRHMVSGVCEVNNQGAVDFVVPVEPAPEAEAKAE